MKTDFTISVNVTFGATSELVTMMAAILHQAGTGTHAPKLVDTHTEEGGRLIADHVDITDNPDGTATMTATGRLEAGEHAAKETRGTDDGKPGEETKENPPKTFIPTLADMRAAMDGVRRKIEGEDYSVNKQGAGYVKYHRNLTAMFRQLASRHGAEKPSELDDAGRAAFIVDCALIRVGEDGKLMYDDKTPF